LRHSEQQRLPQQEIRRTDRSEQAPSPFDNDTLKIATVEQHIMIELSEAVSEKNKIMVVGKMKLILMKQNELWNS
jgi:hypothetical protein